MAAPMDESRVAVADTTETMTAAQPSESAQPAVVTEAEGAQSAVRAERFPLRTAVNYSVATLGTGLAWSLFNFGMPLYLDSYKLAPWLIGFLTNERSGFAILVEPFVGRWSDRARTRLGKRRPFFLGAIPVTALALLLLAFHPPFWAVFVLLAVAAVSIWSARDPYNALLGDLFPPAQRGRVQGMVALCVAVSSIAFTLLAQALWETAEFAVFVVTVGGLLLFWAYTFFTVKEPPISEEGAIRGSDRRADITQASPGAAEVADGYGTATAGRGRKGQRVSLIAYVRGLRNYPQVLKFILADAVFWLGLGGVTPFVTLFAVKALHSSKGEAFLPILAYSVAALLSAIPVGMLADHTSKKLTLTLCMVLFGVAVLAGSMATELWELVVATSIAGIGSVAASSMDIAQLVDLVPRSRRAEIMGVGQGVIALMLPLGATLTGAAAGLATMFVGEGDGYRAPFILGGVTMLTAALLLQRVRPTQAVE